MSENPIDIEVLKRECNHFVNGECRTLGCRQPDGSFSCPTKRVAAELASLRAENERLTTLLAAAQAECEEEAELLDDAATYIVCDCPDHCGHQKCPSCKFKIKLAARRKVQG
jgi:hypothetical protein